MSTEAGTLDWRLDSPWWRLPWTLPGAILFSAITVWALTSFMEQPTHQPPQSPPIDAQLIELPPSAPAVQRKQEPPSPPAKPVPPVKPEPVIPKPQTPPLATAPAPPQAVPVKEIKQTPPPPATAAPAPPMPIPPAPQVPPRQVVSPSSNALSGNSGAQAIVRPMPQIPDDLRDEALEATATARFHVAVDGSATAELVRPTQNPRLNHLLLNTLKNWRFFPAMRDGKPVASIEEIVIHIQVR